MTTATTDNNINNKNRNSNNSSSNNNNRNNFSYFSYFRLTYTLCDRDTLDRRADGADGTDRGAGFFVFDEKGQEK